LRQGKKGRKKGEKKKKRAKAAHWRGGEKERGKVSSSEKRTP